MRDPAEGLSPYSEADYRLLLDRLARRCAAPSILRDVLRRILAGGPRAQERARLLRTGLFDPDFYLATYADIREAGVDPLAHYVSHGEAEGRSPNAMFDPDYYRGLAGAAAIGSMTALRHYAETGEAAGLPASPMFEPRRYLESNPRLAPWLDRPLVHFLWLGRPNGLSAHRRTRLPAEKAVVVPRPEPPPKVAERGLVRGVNIVGPLDRVSGLGVSARGYLEGVTRAAFGAVGTRLILREFARQSRIDAPAFPDWRPDAAISLLHLNGDLLRAVGRRADRWIEGRYTIAVWYWELPTLRPEWQISISRFHEFWAPTRFIADAIRQSTARRVAVMPPYLSHLHGLARRERASAPAHFVYCFDANSVLERKNPGALLDAFRLAFPGDADARLTFKITYPDRKHAEVERLYRAAADDPRVRIIDQILPEAALQALIASATAYVSPHRSEGLGLTVVDAMAAGVPVIATPWGGIDEFVTPQTALPLDYRLVELADDCDVYPKGFVWADPDIESLARALRSARDDPAAAQARASVARERVLAHFASAALIEAYRAALARIADALALPAGQDRVGE